MARSASRRATRRSTRPLARRRRPAPRKTKARSASGWKGREGSPVLDKYAPKPVDAPVGTPPRSAPPRLAAAPATPPPAASAPATPSSQPLPSGLIALDRPFDLDGFSRSLGETALRVSVPREDLAEVLRRITDFMGFGIYVYSVRVYPEPKESLQRFVVELQRVDFNAARGGWIPFEEKGPSDNPFGPSA